MRIKVLFPFFLLISIVSPGTSAEGLCDSVNDRTSSNQNGSLWERKLSDLTLTLVETNTSEMSLNPCTLSINLSSTPYYCTSSFAGSAVVTPSAGTLPYTYSWLPGGQTTDSIPELLAGTYSVTVTDSAGCTATGSVIVATGSATAIATPSTIMAGDSTLLSATCGIPATYSWSPAAYVTNSTLQNTFAHPPVTSVFTVTASTYCGIIESTVTVTVTGCTFSDSIVKSSYYCPSLPGSITLFPYGGTLPYTYSWSPGGQTVATLTGLTAGGYSVTITDGGGCNLTNAITITSANISYSVSVNPLYINPGDSVFLSATCNVFGSYSWSPSASISNPDSANTYTHPLATTEYTVNISTACGTFIDSVKASVNCFALQLNSSPSFNCNASSYDGTATVVPLGGTPPYTYSWSPGGGTTASISHLSSGIYSVTVIDNTGCGAGGVDTVRIKNPVIYTTATPSVIIAGDSTYLSATCDAGAFEYTWSPAAYVTSPNSQNTFAHPPVTTVFTVVVITDTCEEEIAGFDTVVVTGCTFQDSITKTPYYCSALGGSITIFPYGGSTPYTYSWSPGGQTTASVSGLTAGGYDVDIMDANGCNLTNAISVSSSSITYTFAGNPEYIIAGDSLLLTASCNIPAIYSWSPPLTITNPNSDSTYANPSGSTDYTVTITTACGSYNGVVPIYLECFLLNMSSTISYYCPSTSSYDDGTATVSAIGGTPPYTYSWSPGGETTAIITGLSAGAYSITVFDSSGCSNTSSISVSSSNAMFTISANPYYITNGDSTLLTATSNVLATYSWSPSSSVTYPDSANSYAHPSVTTEYTVTITTSCGVSYYPVLITLNCFNIRDTCTPAYCSAYGDTSTAAPLGGTPPYTYLWLPGGQTTDTVFGLSAGTYFVTIEDATGCGSTVPVEVISSGLPPISSSASPVEINRGDSSYLSANCGIPATYIWSPTTGLTDPTSQNTYAQPTVTTIYTVSALTICGIVVSYDTVIVASTDNASELSTSPFKVNIYPNPTNGIITIKIVNKANLPDNESNNMQMEVYNALGEKVLLAKYKNSSPTDSRLFINLSKFNPGVYTLHLQTENMTEVCKIILMK